MSSVKETGYGLSGEISPDDDSCLAVLRESEAGLTYYLKADTAGHLFNPHNPLHQPGCESQYLARRGRRAYELKKVTRERFESYMKYLQGGGVHHLRAAERE
jgi:hypothetical protein